MIIKEKSKPSARLLFFVTEDWYFCSHRLSLAIAARNAGYDVAVVTREDKHGDKIRAAGIKLIPVNLKRRGVNPFREILFICRLISIYKNEQPNIVHHVALKPVLYGSLAAMLIKIPFVINAMAGLGYLFSSSQWKARLLRPLVEYAFHFLLNRNNTCVILQNPDDLDLLIHRRIVSQERASLIRGSGVDLKTFFPTPEPEDIPVVLLASRMLWDKGIGEFVEAASIINQNGIKARFVLVGDSDLDNPASIPNEQLEKWNKSGVVEWWGRKENMPHILSQCNIFCLPSNYGEGVPKVLIEAASTGRAIVTTDAPGCREIVIDHINGLLVPVKNSIALADALMQLIEDPPLRQHMGKQGREIVEAEFSVEKVIEQTLALYRTGLSCKEY